MAMHGNKVRRNISVAPEEEARLLAAVRRDRGASFSHWLVSLGLRRADELEIPETIHEAPPTPQKRAAKKQAKAAKKGG